MSTNTITNSDDIIDLRDVIERFEQLEDDSELHSAHQAEYLALEELLKDCRGCGGDEQWRGDWYPITLIRYSYFKDYAQQLADDIGAIGKDVQWPHTCIDWDQAARELRMDYTAVEFNGITYWTR